MGIHRVDNTCIVRPELAGLYIARSGFGLKPWEIIRSQHGLPPLGEDDLLIGGRSYGITYPHPKSYMGIEYVVGNLSYDAPTEVRNNGECIVGFEPHIERGYFFNVDIDDIADRLGIWNRDPDKEDKARFPVVRRLQGVNDVLYHVELPFDLNIVLKKLAKLSDILEGLGFKPAHSHLYDPRYLLSS